MFFDATFGFLSSIEYCSFCCCCCSNIVNSSILLIKYITKIKCWLADVDDIKVMSFLRYGNDYWRKMCLIVIKVMEKIMQQILMRLKMASFP